MRFRFLACLTLLAAAPAAAETLIVHAGRLITDASKPASGPSTITITDGRITAVAAGLAPAPAGTRLVDLSGKTVLPGLIDMHVHLAGDPGGDFRDEAVDPNEWATLVGAKNARITALAGFTTVRDLGSPPLVGFALRRATAEGFIPGPRIISSGPAISVIGGHGDVSGFRPEVTKALGVDNTCTGPEQCAARVREFSRAGADLIKITATGGVLSQQARGLGQHFTDAEMKSIVDTAHSLGLKVAAHAHSARGIEAAARAGVDSIEHGTFADSRAIAAMKASGSSLVPTLMAFTGIRERLGKGIYTPVVEAKVRETLNEVGKAARAARAAGVPVVFGTDAAVFEHGRNAQELALLVELAGMSPAEAIASATTGAAKLLGLEREVGRIAPGYSGDLIAVDGDPLRDVRALEKVDYVMVRGKAIR
ncbi:MAG TPA: amidohydrolase family protein [Allosphingosinicella sp.]|nr:amidohydrolase family protein [Allosphingosinicella sp.]